jgi:predicted metal-dependent phosphoesterase TrpH
VREAFHKYLSDGGPASAPKVRLPLSEAIRLIREAGGVTSAAHPRPELDLVGMRRLADIGLQAIEAVYPGFKKSRTDALRRMAATLEMGITGGSDCHGPDESRRAVGACTLTAHELLTLRERGANLAAMH